MIRRVAQRSRRIKEIMTTRRVYYCTLLPEAVVWCAASGAAAVLRLSCRHPCCHPVSTTMESTKMVAMNHPAPGAPGGTPPCHGSILSFGSIFIPHDKSSLSFWIKTNPQRVAFRPPRGTGNRVVHSCRRRRRPPHRDNSEITPVACASRLCGGRKAPNASREGVRRATAKRIS
jgi:hypothetical protein